MKKNYIIILFAFASILSVKSQNLWGVDAGTNLRAAEFQQDFVETGVPGNYAIKKWTALSVYDDAPYPVVNTNGIINQPGLAYWKRNTLGSSQGSWVSPIAASSVINFPSKSNGVAIFDSDFLDTGGAPVIAGVFIHGMGSSPAKHKGELISPRINLMGNTNVVLKVKFFRFFRSFDISNLSISFSSDDGATWGRQVSYLDGLARYQLSPNGFKTVTLPIRSTQNITNLSKCRIKFTFEGYYYFAMVDDVTILRENVISPSNRTTPSILKEEISLYTSKNNETINVVGLTKTENYTIFDLYGAEVSKGTVSSNDEINISKLKNGLYFFNLESGERLKFIKE